MKKVLALSLLLIFVCILSATASLKSKIVGTWQLCDKQTMQVDTTYNDFNQMRYKLITPTNFMVTEVKYYNKILYGGFFGRYTLVKDIYTEFIDLTGSGYGIYQGQENRFKISIKGDFMFIMGLNNPYNEVWKRVAKK